MALFTETSDRKRNPLGGRQADGFAWWLATAEISAREAADLLRGRLSSGNPMDDVASDAARHYGQVVREWHGVTSGRDEEARDRFEVGLIAGVMAAYEAAESARSGGHGASDITADGRPVASVAAEYLRACIILAKYTGVSELTVATCQDDQAALMALRNTRN